MKIFTSGALAAPMSPSINLQLNTNGLGNNGINVYPALHLTDNPEKLNHILWVIRHV